MRMKPDCKSKLVRAVPYAVLDVAAVFVAYLVSSWGVVSGGLAPAGLPPFLLMAFFAAVDVVVFAAAHMYSNLWEYASVTEAVRIVGATLAGSVVGDVAALLLFGFRMPLGVYVSAWAILLILTGSSRLLVRLASGRKGWRLFGASSEGLPRSLIVGAGETGSLVVKRMLNCSPDTHGSPIAIVDDDPRKVGSYVHGVRVEGTVDDIAALVARHTIEQIVVAVPSATRAERERIYDVCMATGVRTVTVPSLSSTPIDKRGRVVVRDVEISDLLARDEVELDLSRMGYVTGKRVLVTGGGGSIGGELVRQLLPAKPAEIVLFDVYENTTYELYHELRRSAERAGVRLTVEIGSITHPPALERLFGKHDPQVVFHAAAHKHVPLMEASPREAVENNVFGTLNVCRMAHERGCSHFILISTDKAVNPTNVMGATKRMCELIVQYYASVSRTVFAAVRFGNVLGSHGSVIPLFKRQLREGGPITVTSRGITRYFMTIPEASRLVITAGALARGGEIFILDMGEPVRIWDLAENLVRLSGLVPGRDVDIVETGLRPGEKMYEELLMDEDEPLPTDVADITVSRAAPPDLATVRAKLDELEAHLGDGDREVKLALAAAVPTYHPDLDSEEG